MDRLVKVEKEKIKLSVIRLTVGTQCHLCNFVNHKESSCSLFGEKLEGKKVKDRDRDEYYDRMDYTMLDVCKNLKS
jgi:hypothetical protein